MSGYQDALKSLNNEQKLAVATTEGPVLVIAGPGTGKTQLLTTRIAHILATTDTLPQNILCLTFTDSAAQTMRQRLANLIGQAAYDVTIGTYHAFGSDLIRRFPDYFAEYGDSKPIDDLGIDQIFRSILEQLPYSNPLKNTDVYLHEIKSFVSDAKRALLTPEDIRTIVTQNQAFIDKASPLVQQHLGDMPRVTKKYAPAFTELLEDLSVLDESSSEGSIVPLATLCHAELAAALADYSESGKTQPLTAWKNSWLIKDSDGAFVLLGQTINTKLKAAADIYEKYLAALGSRKLFDYDDMILRAVHALKTNDDLRFTLQEQYLYILLDEFQDTNAAQLKLVELLTDNPVYEGRPNILAVGDDDQAIYAFQGANYSHMLQFYKMYEKTLVVPLTKNYRSSSAILQTAEGISEQIEERLHHHFKAIDKTLTAENDEKFRPVIERREAKSEVSQFAWVAKQIKKLIDGGLSPDKIAVLAPKHKHLIPLLPFLRQLDVPVRYEKRENILDDPTLNQLLRMSELVIALKNHSPAASSLWCEVLSFDFWQLPTSKIWELSWQANDDRETWTQTLYADEKLKPIALFFTRLSMIYRDETLETTLDYLVGSKPLDLREPGFEDFTSPFYDHYFSQLRTSLDKTAQTSFWELLTNLTILRSKLREYKADSDEPLTLQDLIDFTAAHRNAEIKILNTSPYQEANQAVQIMTAYKAKGMEFDAVFLLACNDNVWGSSSRSRSHTLSLPANLQFIRYAGATNDERLRLFYVAVTRAKANLYLLNYTANFSGKSLASLKYLAETTNEAGDAICPLLPPKHQTILPIQQEVAAASVELESYWQQRHEQALTSSELKALIMTRLEKFQLSSTHVNKFIDIEHGGPIQFFIDTILRFPKAPTPSSQYGNAIHETLEWIHIHNKKQDALPSFNQIFEAFTTKLKEKRLGENETARLLERGKAALKSYVEQRLHTVSKDNESEYNFRNEGVFIGKAHLTGKIDKLIIDKATKTITVVDYKTGKSHVRWSNESSLHKYRQQLYIYKVLIEKSHHFAGYKVNDAYLEFVEPDDNGKINELHLNFDDNELKQVEKLTEIVWQKIQNLEMPDTSEYDQNLKGILAFEQDLLTK